MKRVSELENISEDIPWNTIEEHLKMKNRDFPGGPDFSFQCRGCGLDPCSGS